MDRVQVLKRETAALGGDAADEAPWDAPIEPQEDAVETAGVYVQDASNRDETTLIDRAGNDLRFKDGNNTTPLTLSELKTDQDAVHDNVAGEIAAVALKATPVSGDLLLIEDSADSNNKKRVTVGSLPGGGGGEANTASNVNVGGVGVFKQKTLEDLEFRGIKAASSKVSVALDAANNEIDVDVVEANVVHDNLNGAGTNTHAQIDTHIADTANPHSVTAAQVGNTTAQWNANQLQGEPINASAPIASDVLIYSGSEWVHVQQNHDDQTNNGGAGSHAAITAELATTIHDNVAGEISAVTEKVTPVSADLLLIEDSAAGNAKKRVQIGNLPGGAAGGNTEFFDGYDSAGGTAVAGSWVDIPLGTERRKDADFTHSASSAEVTVDSTRVYYVAGRVTTETTAGTSRSQVEMRLMLDTGGGYAEIGGTRGAMYAREVTEGSGTAIAVLAIALTSGDKIKMQAMRVSGTSTIQTMADGSSLVISNMVGEKGDDGPAGGGETNTASNIGSEVEVFKQKVGVDLEFRTLDEDGGLNISQEANTVKLSTGFRRNFLLMGA